jgi:hypothetical protein
MKHVLIDHGAPRDEKRSVSGQLNGERGARQGETGQGVI